MKAYAQGRAAIYQRNPRAVKAGARGKRGILRLAPAEESGVLSERLDDAAEYERIMKEFEALREEARSAESFS